MKSGTPSPPMPSPPAARCRVPPPTPPRSALPPASRRSPRLRHRRAKAGPACASRRSPGTRPEPGWGTWRAATATGHAGRPRRTCHGHLPARGGTAIRARLADARLRASNGRSGSRAGTADRRRGHHRDRIHHAAGHRQRDRVPRIPADRAFPDHRPDSVDHIDSWRDGNRPDQPPATGLGSLRRSRQHRHPLTKSLAAPHHHVARRYPNGSASLMPAIPRQRRTDTGRKAWMLQNRGEARRSAVSGAADLP